MAFRAAQGEPALRFANADRANRPINGVVTEMQPAGGETYALAELMAPFRIGDATAAPVAKPSATLKANPGHAVQRKVANFVGAGRLMGGPAQPTLASAPGSWEGF